MQEIDHRKIEEIIIDAKKNYRTVFSTVVGGELFIWRLLSGIEYEIISKTSDGDALIKEELICQQAVIYPTINFSLYKAGIPSVLAPQIITESGFNGTEKSLSHLNNCRGMLFSQFQEQAYVIIASAFPQYKFEEIEDWDIEKLIKMIARAEWKFNMIDGKEFIFEQETPEEETQEKDVDEKEKLKELEGRIIEQGGDPIFTLYDKVYKEQKEYVCAPIIMGNNFDREEVVNVVREKIHERLSNSRRLL